MYLDVKLASDLGIVVPSPNRKNGFLYTNQFDKIYIPVVEYIEKELETPFNNRIAVLNAGMGSGKTYMGPFEFLPVGIRKAQILGLWGLWLFTAPDTTINDGTINDLESALDDCGVCFGSGEDEHGCGCFLPAAEEYWFMILSRMPLMNAPELVVEKRLPISMASLMETLGGMSSRCRSS